MAEMTGGQAVAATLEALGVTHVFGIVSVHNLPTYEALDASGIEVVACRHEQFAVHAADGHARATGRLGVALTSTGPGTTNALSGLYEAQFGSSPVLLVTGQIESAYYGKGKGFLHESERQLDLLRQVTRRAETIWRTEDIGPVLADVAASARRGRPQPVAVEIPIDQQYRTADVEIPAVEARARREPVAAEIDAAAEALAGAERPLLWAGGGAVSADASAELTALAERLRAPVITTIEGRGAIDERHELALGARTERPLLTPIIGEADVVLAVGTRFQNYSTRVWSVPIPGTLIHLDADPAVIGRNYPADVAVVADAKLGLAALHDRLTGAVGADAAFVARAREAVDADLERSAKEIGADHGDLVRLMRAAMPDDAVLVRDSTVPVYLWGNRLLPIVTPRSSIRPSSVAIGPGIGLAVGAATSGRPTVLMVGDGGFQLGIGELATVAQYGWPMVICVFNDRGYGVLREIQDAVRGHRFGVDIHTPDFVQVGRGMGLDAVAVSGVDEFEAEFGAAIGRGTPTLLDIDLGALAPMTFPLPPHQRRN